jgi:hypothetical protein
VLKPEDTSYTAGSLYVIDLVKDGSWKIKKWEIRIQWTTAVYSTELRVARDSRATIEKECNAEKEVH